MSRPMTSSALPKSKTLDNKYVLGDEIGKGAYGRVYKGLDLENGDFVAIKQVSLANVAQEDLSGIMQEIDLLKNLNHKNIVKYLGSVKTKSHLHIILEYAENGSLANIIKPNKFGPFPESLAAFYIAQVLEGLVYLHEQGVIHRDIKGANILTTKEGLVKLADFGVATKLNEADVNTRSVVGTSYWIAPEAIEMSGVCAGSDIWSVGCTVIELLTCVPPYYDLQPMPAMYRIVQDEHPPIPDGLSPEVTDFLLQCFKKDSSQRPDANSLLSHPWIQNSRHALQTSLRHSGTLKEFDEAGSGVSKLAEGKWNSVETSSLQENGKELPTLDASLVIKSCKDDSLSANPTKERKDNLEEDVLLDQVPTFAIHEKSSKHSSSSNLMRVSGKAEPTESTRQNALSGNKERRGTRDTNEHTNFAIHQNYQDYTVRKVPVAAPMCTAANELSRFSDSPGDASLDDLFHPLDKLEAGASEESPSASSSHVIQCNTSPDSGRIDLAAKFRAAIAQKIIENDSAQANGDNLLHLMGLECKLPSENLFQIQAGEFSKLVSSLRPDEPEDLILSSCQKLINFFHHRPDHKSVFVSQHGLLYLMELLEVPRTSVICSTLQLLNYIVKDSNEIQENACLVGLIPVVMSYAVHDRPWEVRMEAAYFLQQLCESSSFTLQMLISCRGIPILVGFLEADYAKYREMVHMAINSIWQVFKLQKSTSMIDFFRIAAKNGILLRLVNTLYSLNEVTRIAPSVGLPSDGFASRQRSGPLESGRSLLVQNGSFLSLDSQPDPLKVKQVDRICQTSQKTSRASLSHSLVTDKYRSNSAIAEVSGASRPTVPASHDRGPYLNGYNVTVSGVEDKLNWWKNDSDKYEVDMKQQRAAINRASMDKTSKSVDGMTNGYSAHSGDQQDNVRPLLSLLDKEPPSRHSSGQLDHGEHLTMIENHEIRASTNKKANGLDFLMAEFADVTGRGKENLNVDPLKRSPPNNKKLGPQMTNGGTAITSGPASQKPSGVLSGSGILNASPWSATSSGLLLHKASSWNVDVAPEYLEKVAALLLEFAAADTAVKSYMCSQSLLSRLFQLFNKIDHSVLLTLLKCINHLSTDPHCLEHLQRADAIKHLIPNLDLKEGAHASEIHHEVLYALFNLCKINKRRQEQAAENGIVPHLMHFITIDSPLKQYALPLLCDMAHSSRNSREQLQVHGGVDMYLNLLEDDAWSVTALDSLAVCLANDDETKKVEQTLLKEDAVQKLVAFFRCCSEQQFLNILEPFLKMITKSSSINTTLAVNGLTPLLISRLDHPDAIARLNLLKLIKAVYEHHPRPKQLIMENNLPQKLQSLIEERRDSKSSGGQVLVKQMATSLLKALDFNTII